MSPTRPTTAPRRTLGARRARPTGARGMAAAVVAVALALLSAGPALAASPGSIPRPPGENPGGRGWEKVTPDEKGGLDVGGVSYRTRAKAAAGGGGLLFASQGVFAGGPTGGFPSYYVTRRQGDGWATTPASPAGTASLYGVRLSSPPGRTPMVLHADDDLDRAVVETNSQITPGSLPGVFNLYDADLRDGSFRLMTPVGPGYLESAMAVFGEYDAAPYFEAASTDGREVVFRSSWPYTAGAPTSVGRNYGRLFQLSADGGLRLVSVMPDGTPAESAFVGGNNSTHHAVSDDGERIYFRAPEDIYDGHSQFFHPLYLRDGNETVVVDPDPVQFVMATPDGAKVLYQESEDEGGGIFLYDATTRTRELLSVDNEPADALLAGASVLTASEDLEYVYFVGFGRLVSGQQDLSGIQSIYLWHDGVVRRVGALTDNQDPGNEGPGTIPRAAYPYTNNWINRPYVSRTPDGRSVVFDTSARVTGYDAGGFRQVYRYDADTDEMRCLSCPDGPATGDAVLQGRDGGYFGTHPRPLGALYSISEDGRRVFFNSKDSLVPGDVNNRIDVYVWEEGLGVHLVSDGVGEFDSRFVDASADGDDVYFATANRLVGSDRDDLVDIYDARVGGGFAEPGEGRAGCVGDGCQGDAEGRSAGGVPASGGLRSAGEAAAGVRGSLRLAGLSVAQRSALSRGAAVRIRLAVNRAGRVAVTARARVRGRQRVVGRASARARRAGKVTVRLRLTRAARVAIRAGGRLEVRLTAHLAGGGSSVERVLDLARPSGAKASANVDGR